MASLKLDTEPYQISARLYRAIQERAQHLEEDARNDETFAASLEHPGHLQRQNLLIQAQRDQAERFRSFLATAQIRP
jgi:hypothetical protein